MPVQVPTIKRMETSAALPKNDRINLQVQDQGAQIMQRTSAINSLGDQGAQIYQKAENEKIDQLSNAAEQEYKAWNDSELEKIKNIQGDPTDAYAAFETSAKEKRDSILSSREGLPDRVARHMTARLDKAIGAQNIAVGKQRGMQQEVYANNLFESTVKMKKDTLATSAGYISRDDETSFAPFDQGLTDIKTLIAKRAVQQGTAKELDPNAEQFSHQYTDEDGKIVKISMTPMAKQRAAKDLSEGVKTSIEVMIAGGQVEEAKLMRERYKGYIDPASGAAIDNKFKKAGRQTEAFNFLTEIKGQNPESQLEAIDEIEDAELQSEVLKRYTADNNRRTALKENMNKANYEVLAKNVLDKMNSSQPYYGLADLENDPLYKQTWDKLSAKGQKAIQEMVEAPKDSNPKSELKVQNLFFGTDPDKSIETMTPEEFQEYTVGLSKSDKAAYTTRFMSLRTQSEGEKRSMYSQAGKMLQEQLLIDGHIERNKYGKIGGDDEIELLKAQSELMNHLGKEYGVMKPDQLQKYVKDYSASVIKGKVFNPAPRTNVFRAKNDTTAKSADVPLSGPDITNLKRQFKAVNGYFPPTNDEKFKLFVQRNRKS